MKVYFVRHGEGLDDVYNEFGGWSDRELSPNGINLAFKLAQSLKTVEKKNGKFDIIYSSPLKRCVQTADIIGNDLSLRVEELPYLKERNTYGLLSGVNREEAQAIYPDLLKSFNQGCYIPAAERYKDFVERVAVLLEYLKKLKLKNIICVTHGHLITVLAEEFLSMIRDRVYDGAIFGIEIMDKGSLKYVYSSNIKFTKDKKKLKMSNKFRL